MRMGKGKPKVIAHRLLQISHKIDPFRNRYFKLCVDLGWEMNRHLPPPPSAYTNFRRSTVQLVNHLFVIISNLFSPSYKVSNKKLQWQCRHRQQPVHSAAEDIAEVKPICDWERCERVCVCEAIWACTNGIMWAAIRVESNGGEVTMQDEKPNQTKNRELHEKISRANTFIIFRQ